MRIVIFIVSIFLFAFAVFLTYSGETGDAAVTYTAAFFCLTFAFLQDLKKLRGFAAEAKMLEKKIEEADNTLNQLRNLIKPTSELLFTMVARGGRLESAIPRQDCYRLMTEFTSKLKTLGLSESEIAKAKKDWHKFNLIDLSRPIVDGIQEILNGKMKAQQKINQSFKPPISPHIQLAHRVAIEETQRISDQQQKLLSIYKMENCQQSHKLIHEFLDSCYLIGTTQKDQILDDFKEQLRDLEYYIEHHEFRRLESWFNA